MRVHRYSRWDGQQTEFSMDVKSALDALSDLMMEGRQPLVAMALPIFLVSSSSTTTASS